MQEIKPQSRLENWKHNLKNSLPVIIIYSLFYGLPSVIIYRTLKRFKNEKDI